MSEKLLTATVEIFYDAECGTPPTEPILEGIAMIGAVAGRLEVVRATRQLVVSKRNAPGVEPHKIHWPAFDADINVVITERPFDLGRSDDYADLSAEATIMGVALRWQQVAMVNAKDATFPAMVTGHELAHLFGLKSRVDSNAPDRVSHCDLSNCLMYPTVETGHVVQPRPRKGLSQRMERIGLVWPRRAYRTECLNSSFLPRLR